MQVLKVVQIHYLYFKRRKMVNIFLFLAACLCIPLAISWRGLMHGPGQWLVKNVGHCDNPEEYEIDHKIIQKKINRTHDYFDIIFYLDRVVNSSFGIQIDVFKKRNGGFKYYQSLSDSSLCTFLEKHARDNVKRALTMADIDPPKCPYRAGPIIIRNFVIDYREFPKQGVYGTFQTIVYVTYGTKKVVCLKTIINFDQRNDDDDFI